MNDLNEQADELLQTGAATLPGGGGGGGGSFSLPTTPPSATSFGGGISNLEPDYLLGSDKRLLSPLGRQQVRLSVHDDLVANEGTLFFFF